MIGAIIERLKNPKNVGGWLVFGWGLCVVGFFARNWIGPLGQGIAVVGLAAIIIPLIQLSITKVLYAIPIAALVIGYVIWYGHAVPGLETTATVEKTQAYEEEYEATKRNPVFADSGVSNTVQRIIFAPAFMGDTLIRYSRWAGSDTFLHRRKWKGSELGEGLKEYDKHKGK